MEKEREYFTFTSICGDVYEYAYIDDNGALMAEVDSGVCDGDVMLAYSFSEVSGEWVTDGWFAECGSEESRVLYTADRETGTFIHMVDSVEEGMELIKQYEQDDKDNAVFVENFYDVVDQNHCSVMDDIILI